MFTLFEGYDWVTFLVVANLAFSGLLVSWVMKFADSILKVRGFLFFCMCTCAPAQFQNHFEGVSCCSSSSSSK